MTPLKARLICEIVKGKLYGNPDIEADKVITDSRKSEKGALFFALKGEKFDGADFLKELDGKISIAVSSRFEEVSYPLIVVEDTLLALQELSKYYIKNISKPEKVIALTGSVGKTTTKEMTAAVFETKFKTAKTSGNFNNHIGVPLTLLSCENDDKVLVTEMGMSNKGEISRLTSLVESDIAMITNIGHSHIENLGSRENIRDAKLEISEGLKKGGTLIINGEEPLLENVKVDGQIIRVGLHRGLEVWAENIEATYTGLKYTLHLFDKTQTVELSVLGEHNVMNSLFALTAGYISDIPLDIMIEGLKNYKPVGLRQNIYEKSGVTVIADCYNAGIESMCASLKLLSTLNSKGKRIAILGDMLELGTISKDAHQLVGQRVAENKIDMLFAFGKEAKAIYEKAKSLSVNALYFETKKELADKLKEIIKEGDTLLFKASRGMKFEEIIALLGLEK